MGMCESVQSVFALSTSPPDSDDAFIFPQGTLVNTLFHSGSDGNPDLLWRLFRAACQGAASIDAADFRGALEIRNVALPKLTQTLFLVNPSEFLPLDDATRRLLPNPSTKVDNWDSYQAALTEVRDSFPGCTLYEANLVAWLCHSGTFSTLGKNAFQVSTNVYGDGADKWDEFNSESAVWTGGPRSGIGWDDSSPATELKYPLKEPDPGDLILVRNAAHGRAIGLVYRNDYADKVSSKARLHVVWINRRTVSDLLTFSLGWGFRKAPNIAAQFFDNDAYHPTRTLLERLGYEGATADESQAEPGSASISQNDRNADINAPLNQILYGPPGTGKTFRTTELAVSIVDGSKEVGQRDATRKRFKELRFDPKEGTGNVALVTFHQNFAYEDFVEGIRPVLDEDENDLHYERRDGIFKLIATAASRRRSERFVLIIDEINRGNIAKIFGELITLIEGSRRLERHDETFATLQYSQTSFSVPPNLYLVGTMDTADRSIQLLDTALRRRFTFRECMPEPDHPLISTDVNGVNCRELLRAINERIALLLDREHQIGHTYFLNIDSLDKLADVFRDSVFPLLQEYFFDDWAKIRAVLANNAFVVERKPKLPFNDSDLIDEDRKVYDRLAKDDERWFSPEQYQAIYRLGKTSTNDE